MLERAHTRRTRGAGVVATAAAALALFLALLVVLAVRLREHPPAAAVHVAPRVVIVRRVYETIVHERVIGATGPNRPTTISTSSVAVPGASATPVATHAS